MNPWTYLDRVLAAPPESGRRAIGCPGPARALVAAVLLEQTRDFVLFVLPHADSAARFATELEWHLALAGRPSGPIPVLPDNEVDPYRGLSPHPRILERRSRALWTLLEGRPRCLVTTPGCLLERLPRPEEFISRLLDLRVNASLPLEEIRRRLEEGGYILEEPVTEPGEFAVRGGVLDVFTPNRPHPLRVEFFGDYVESIRSFDPATQRSIESLPYAAVIPLTPYPSGRLTWQELARRIQRPGLAGELGNGWEETAEQLSGGVASPGWEFLLPLTEPLSGSLWDYLPGEVRLVSLVEQLGESLETLVRNLEERWQTCAGQGRLALPPGSHVHPAEDAAKRVEALPGAVFEEFSDASEHLDSLKITPTISFLGNFTGLVHHIANTGEHILFVLSSRGRCERIQAICEEYGLPHSWIEAPLWSGLDLSGGRRLIITQGPIERGFRLPELSLAVLGSGDIFPPIRHRPVELKATRGASLSAFFSDFRDLKPGDPVVHLDHGVGVFRGLERMSVGGLEQEFVLLEYAERAKLYVPAERLDLIQKFGCSEGALPPLDRLGGVTWQKTRTRVKKALRDMAGELLKLYARRASTGARAFPPDDHWQMEFEDMFEFEETVDQLRAIEEIKRDMESERPMDRLLCGDVGYGKTEVAMRAVFKAAGGGRQVAVLAPTTILAFQHYHTFQNRFASFPFRIEMLSRFRHAREQKEVVQDLAEGKVDIIIGTHRLLSKDVRFHDLGLLVVDEEQRFGVTHKERVKQMRADVDVLTLTATPIPRTLHMGLSGLRDISVIETPPKDRLSIQTQVVRFSEEIIREAIQQELVRHGQVYFVHNRVESIYEMAGRLRELLPEVRLVVAHGQMQESELERILLDFIAHRYDVLLSTTIIENGIDIPLVNTIIINQAHMFGLAQLYQLRGRVGRSNRRAFAWLLVPAPDRLNDVARRRLTAIRDFTELGSGFRLAALDLEIRGAGNLLGAEQHGHMQAVGFEMYTRLLEEAIRELKGEVYVPPERIQLNLQIKLRLPADYIPREEQRLQIYKRIAAAGDESALHDLREEIKDRFGVFPEVLDYLFEYTRLRLLAQQLSITSIDRKMDLFRIQFSKHSPIDPDRLIRKVKAGEPLTFSPEGLLAIRLPHSNIPEMFNRLKSTLLDLSPVLQSTV